MSEVEVIGFEGVLTEGFHVTWGAAALRVNDRLVNGLNGLSEPFEDAQRLAAEARVVLLPEAIPMLCWSTRDDLVVVAVNKSSPYAELLGGEVRFHSLRGHSAESCYFAVIHMKDIRELAEDIGYRIAERFVSAPMSTDDMNSLVAAGLVLDHTNETLNALHICLTPEERRPNAVRLARAMAEAEDERERARQLAKPSTSVPITQVQSGFRGEYVEIKFAEDPEVKGNSHE